MPHTLPNSIGALALCAAFATAQQPGSLVVPSSATVADASHAFALAGTNDARRQLLLVDASLLTAAAGRDLTKLTFRRDASAEPLPAGTATLTVRLSHGARTPASASDQFAANLGLDETTTFQGTVALPASAAAPGPSVAWTAANIVEIPFATPFHYTGGTLAIDLVGAAPAAGAHPWWPIDAVWQTTNATESPAGTGSGGYGGATGEWSFVSTQNLTPGGSASFVAIGDPGDLGLLAIADAPQLQAVDLGFLGVPGTWMHIRPPFHTTWGTFGPLSVPQQPALGALATIDLQVPPTPLFLGANLASQWFRLDAAGRVSSSNASLWTIAQQAPSLGLALISAPVVAGEPTVGKVRQAYGHVVRVDFQ